ncbi:MAG: hypothetical protein OHK0046_24620 [Anaerolineae bacterium]
MTEGTSTTDNSNRTNDLDILDDVIIESISGNREDTVIDGGTFNNVIHVGPITTDVKTIVVTIRNLRITGANGTSSAAPYQTGAGIFIDDFVNPLNNNTLEPHTLNLENVIINDNEGSGVSTDRITNVNIQNSDIRNNRGGGIANVGTMTITNSTIRNNIGGPGIRNTTVIYNEVSFSGTLTMTNSIVSDNVHTGNGGGFQISTGATTSITSSQILRNESNTDGGGLYIERNATIDKTVIAANIAGRNGGGFYASTSAGSSSIMVTNTTISENISYGDDANLGRGGGGFYNYAARVTARNVTLSGNRAVGAKGVSEQQGRGAGGGFYYRGFYNPSETTQQYPSFTELNNVTITDNRATIGGGFYTVSQYANTARTLRVVRVGNTIITSNTVADLNPDCRDSTNSTESLGNNVLSTSSGCPGFTEDTDTVGGGAGLNPLADNGGLTCTHAIQAETSTAVNNGNPDTCEANDQRGGNRVNSCDIGAFEFGANVASSGIECRFGNETPIAADDDYEVNFNSVLTVPTAQGVLLNDSDPDGVSTNLSAILENDVDNGTVVLNSDGSFIYTPDNGFVGEDSFTYFANDGIDNSNVSTVTITVLAPNPIAVNDTYTTNPGQTLQVNVPGVLTNDLDPNPETGVEDLIAVLSQDIPTGQGSLVLNQNGSFVYTPGTFTGTTSFTYIARNSVTALDSVTTGKVTINVTQTAPTAVDDAYNAPFSTAATPRQLSVTAADGVLANDTDPNSNPLTAVIVGSSTKAGGSIILNANGSFTFTPDNNYVGEVFFDYKANDGTEDSNTARITFTISDTAPLAINDSYFGEVDVQLTRNAQEGVLANDNDPNGDAMTAVVVETVSEGTLTLNADGSFAYTPPTGEAGIFTFTYKVEANGQESNVATVTITISDENAPVAANDSYTTPANTTLAVPQAQGVLANDTDPGSATLTAQVVTSPEHGDLTLNSNGSFTYIPDTDYVGSDTFTYQANNGTTNSGPATVTITITEAAAELVAANDVYTTPPNTTLSVPAPGVRTNDTVPTGVTANAVKVSDPTSGTVVLGSDGQLVYIPVAAFTGDVSFTYKLVNVSTNAESNTATVTISVTDSPTALVATDDNYNTAVGQTLTIAAPGVLSNDTGTGTLSASKLTDPASGTLVLSADGAFTYIPVADFTGAVSFTYNATNGTETDSATVTINVGGGGGNAPVANGDTYTTAPGESLAVAAPGLLTNDTDADDDVLTAAKASDPANGTVTVDVSGAFTYIPNSGFSGVDTFTYTASDGVNTSPAATVTIVVTSNAGGELNLISPAGTVSNTVGNPLFTWLPVSNAFAYDLYVENTITKRVLFYNRLTATDHCTQSLCSVDLTTLPGGDASWHENGSYVAWITVADSGNWKSFEYTIQANLPGLVTLADPTRVNETSRPTLNFTLDGDAANSAWFEIFIGARSGSALTTYYYNWHSRREACGSMESTTCAFPVPTDLINWSSYELYIRSWGPGGFSTGGIQGFTNPLTFAVNSPVIGTLAGFATVTASTTPTLTWTHDAGASWYEIWIGTPDFLYTGHIQWYFADDLGCEDGTCELSPSVVSSIAGLNYDGLDLIYPGTDYVWYLRAWGAANQFNQGGVGSGWTEAAGANFRAP